MSKKLVVVLTIIALQLSTVFGLAFANQSNHGSKVSEVAKSTPPGPGHGETVSEAARDKSANEYAISFDGIDDFVSVLSSDNYNFGRNNFSIEWWEYRKRDQGTAIARDNYLYTPFLLALGDPTNHLSAVFMSTYNDNDYAYDNHKWDIASYSVWGGPGGNTLDNVLNQWSHLAVIRNGSTFKLYRDGLEKNTWESNLSLADSDGSMLFGASQNHEGLPSHLDATYGQYLGLLDDIRIWNKALTQEEVQANMYKEIKPQDGLVGYWKFDEGSGVTAKDSSGNGNDGTLVNGPTWTAETPF